MNDPVRFDVVVVGGGTAGCVLASRLSEEGTRSVCLVTVAAVAERIAALLAADSELPPS